MNRRGFLTALVLTPLLGMWSGPKIVAVSCLMWTKNVYMLRLTFSDGSEKNVLRSGPPFSLEEIKRMAKACKVPGRSIR